MPGWYKATNEFSEPVPGKIGPCEVCIELTDRGIGVDYVCSKHGSKKKVKRTRQNTDLNGNSLDESDEQERRDLEHIETRRLLLEAYKALRSFQSPRELMAEIEAYLSKTGEELP